ncbi:2-octaprenyl-6-methoxyphenyl hydroxylase [Brevirhabdus pacifica]|uniref:2-octaprenyl-6-methoxyphenyl hydroxylase n=2 Tax=Brevirhabdus pacifica TaxID=1267768 RepID=A0A1U7DH19_9RHOB|nr:UbiH/UbiF family hydroxylase [Brevirhabdus pacifica]APX89290.1 2-octaprenyl-6-methoxyphenyl hydroxylase [Brevirhabdus pacifica]PJJ86094.1 2-octaprenyl-6-methoxyphenol hydroxylase [Brevirhabdus pacifica]
MTDSQYQGRSARRDGRPERPRQTDVLISGGGIAGLTAAAAFGSAGYAVICVDPAPQVTEAEAPGADLRTTALLQPARALLRRAGVWDRLLPHASALRVMRIVDAGGEEAAPRATCDFESRDLSEDTPFGWNFPNWLLRRELLARLNELPHVTLLPGTATRDVLTREAHAHVTLSQGAPVRARLLIAADGRESRVREALGITARVTRYGQKALTFAVGHDRPHDNVSTEVHRTGGPFTLVPLPDHEGRPRSAVVWMESGPEAQRLASLDVAEFEALMTERSAGVLGPLRLIGPRGLWPIVSQIAERLTAQRSALIAEAAHVVPPIGAQGLNMSIGDIALLLDLALESGGDPGSDDVLDAYQRRRWPELRARVAGVDLLNRASMAGAPILRDGRLKGLELIHGLAPVRTGLMRLGLGAGAEAPGGEATDSSAKKEGGAPVG